MTRLKNQVPAEPAERARAELAAAREHMRAAAKHGAGRLGETSRRTRRIARRRATYAARALRGERPASPWRWLGIGLAAGAAIGTAGAVAARQLLRRPAGTGEELPEQARHATAAVREKAGATVEAVRERAGAAAQRATEVARDTATKVRGATRGEESEPPEPPEPGRDGAPARATNPTAAGE